MLEFAGAPELAERFALDRDELEEPDAMVPLPLLHALLEAMVESTGDPYFGLHFAASVDASRFKRRVGAVGLMLLTSPNMAAGLDSLVRHQNLFNEGDRYAVVQHGEETHVRFEAWGPERPGRIQMAEKTAAQILMILSLAEPAISPIAVRFAHGERAGSEELAKVLGVVPTFGAECTTVVVRADDLQRPVRGADPDMFRFFDRHLTGRIDIGPDGRASRVRLASTTHEDLTRSAIRDALHRGEYSSQHIADQLDMPLRTLQRRLAAEGTGLKTIVDEVRRLRSQRLLETDMPIRDVAILLGYSGATPFVRAFKRWFETTPAAWRASER